MIRYTSTTRSGEMKNSVVFPVELQGSLYLFKDENADGDGVMSGEKEDATSSRGEGGKEVKRCAVEGCGKGRKYRLVGDFGTGACGISHLKLLEKRTAVV